MTREEQAKKDCAIVVSDDMEYGTPFVKGYNKGIEAGVKWADAHPNWRKYPEEPPTESKDYIVAFEDGMAISSYSVRRECFGIFRDDIVAWTELPKKI